MRSTGARIGIGWIVVALLAAAGLAGAVLAQRGQGGPGGPGMPPMRPGPPPVMMKAGTQGVFVLTGLTLHKYDPALTEHKELKLADEPAGDVGRPMPPRPALMLIAGGASEKVLVLVGDDFYSVDAATLSVTAKATLPAIKPPDQEGETTPGPGPGPGPGMRPMGPPLPVVELVGQTLYVQRANQIIGISITDGKLVGPATLPKPPMPGGGD